MEASWTGAKHGDADVKAALVGLDDLVAASTKQQARVDRLAKLIDIWRSQLFGIVGPGSTEGIKTLGAEGALNRILRTLQEINADDKRDLAARDLARKHAFASAYWINGIEPVLALVVAALLGWAVHRLFAEPIARLTETMRRLAGGDTSIEIPFIGWQEEIGAMGRALSVFRDAVRDAADLRDAQHITEQRVLADRSALMASMADRFEGIVGSIVADVSTSALQVEAAAESLLSLAEWTGADIRTVTGITRQASTTMQQVASGTQSLSDAVGDINEHMAHSTSIARKAVAGGRSHHVLDPQPRAVGGEGRDDRLANQRHRATYQSPRLECHDRGGAGRRGRPWLQCRRRRGEEPRDGDGTSDGPNPGADRGHAHRRRRSGRCHRRDQPDHLRNGAGDAQHVRRGSRRKVWRRAR